MAIVMRSTIEMMTMHIGRPTSGVDIASLEKQVEGKRILNKPKQSEFLAVTEFGDEMSHRRLTHLLLNEHHSCFTVLITLGE